MIILVILMLFLIGLLLYLAFRPTWTMSWIGSRMPFETIC